MHVMLAVELCLPPTYRFPIGPSDKEYLAGFSRSYACGGGRSYASLFELFLAWIVEFFVSFFPFAVGVMRRRIPRRYIGAWR